jgi:hypothetical protein
MARFVLSEFRRFVMIHLIAFGAIAITALVMA